MFRDITPARFSQIHGEAFQDSEYLESSTALTGHGPSSALWDWLSLPGTSVLEIGPGSGHLLAAAQQAGRSVAAVESSEIHRNFIRKKWDIGSIYSDIDDIPDGSSFDAIVAINVFEHIYDIEDFLRSMRKVLAPGGTLFISTPNGISLDATVLKIWWSMCKVHDHVSFPSPTGLAMAARATGLRAERIWSSGLPFEFPVSALVAARDRFLARRDPGSAVGHGQAPARAEPARAGTVNASLKAGLARFYSAAAPFDPTARLLASLGRAGTVKARLTR